jgi:hypothetical protein
MVKNEEKQEFFFDSQTKIFSFGLIGSFSFDPPLYKSFTLVPIFSSDFH